MNRLANWKSLSIEIYDNPVPSRDSDIAEGQTTRTNVLTENMKLVLLWRNSMQEAPCPYH